MIGQAKRQSFKSNGTPAGTGGRHQQQQRRSVSNSGQGFHMKILSETSHNAYGSGQLQLNPSDALVMRNGPQMLLGQLSNTSCSAHFASHSSQGRLAQPSLRQTDELSLAIFCESKEMAFGKSLGKNIDKALILNLARNYTTTDNRLSRIHLRHKNSFNIGKAVAFPKRTRRPTTSNHQRTFLQKYPKVADRNGGPEFQVGSVRAFSNIGYSKGGGPLGQFKCESVVTTTVGPQSSSFIGVHNSPTMLNREAKNTSQALAISGTGSSHAEVVPKTLTMQPSVQVEYHGGRIAERLIEMANTTSNAYQGKRQKSLPAPSQPTYHRAQYQSGLGSMTSNSPTSANIMRDSRPETLQQRSTALGITQMRGGVRNANAAVLSHKNPPQMPKSIALQIVPQQQNSVRVVPSQFSNVNNTQHLPQSEPETVKNVAAQVAGFTNLTTESASDLTMTKIGYHNPSGSALTNGVVQLDSAKGKSGMRQLGDGANQYNDISAYQSNFSPLNDDYTDGLITSPGTAIDPALVRTTQLDKAQSGRIPNFSTLLRASIGSGTQQQEHQPREINSQLNQILQAEIAETDIVVRQTGKDGETTHLPQNPFRDADHSALQARNVPPIYKQVTDLMPETIPELHGQEISFLEMPRGASGDNDISSFVTVGTKSRPHNSSCQITLNTSARLSLQEMQDQYIDLQEFNTSANQVRKKNLLLNMNVDKLKRRIKSKPRVNLDDTCFQSGKDYQTTVQGQMRIVNNIEAHLNKADRDKGVERSKTQKRRVQTEIGLSPQECYLPFDRFTVNDALTNIENKPNLNPSYFDHDQAAFDLRADSKPGFTTNTRLVKSAFWNKKTCFVLQKKVADPQTNIYTNTRSFAKKFSRGAPKHKIKQQNKRKSDQPQPGYYDTKEAFDKHVAPKLINSVRMDTELARKDAFAGKKDEYWKSLDNKQEPNMWVGENVPQGYLEFAEMVNREKGTNVIDNAHLKWMFLQSADQIYRAKLEKARQGVIRTKEEKEPVESLAFDMSLENSAQPFTFDIRKMHDCTRLQKIGIEMLDEKIKRELKKPDEKSQ